MDNQNISALVLAAGKGTRMKSGKAKVLHEVFFEPMINHVLDALKPLPLEDVFIVTGHQRSAVEESLQNYNVSFIYQEEQLGTGHAVKIAEEPIRQSSGHVLILCGDTPLVRTKTLFEMLESHLNSEAKLTIMTTEIENPTNYGRIVTDENGHVMRIVEEKDASEKQKKLREINAGIYFGAVDYIYDALTKVDTNNKQGEFYLTDIVEIANNEGIAVNKYVCQDPLEVLGVNSRVELAEAHNILQERNNQELMSSGVTIIHPETVSIEKTVIIGKDTCINPNVFISGTTKIGKGCTVEPFTIIKNCHLGDDVMVRGFSYLENCMVSSNEKIDPRTTRMGK